VENFKDKHGKNENINVTSRYAETYRTTNNIVKRSIAFQRLRAASGRLLVRPSSFDNMHVFRFHDFGLKMPIHAPKIEGFEDFTAKWGAMLCQRNPKRHIFARVRVV